MQIYSYLSRTWLRCYSNTCVPCSECRLVCLDIKTQICKNTHGLHRLYRLSKSARTLMISTLVESDETKERKNLQSICFSTRLDGFGHIASIWKIWRLQMYHQSAWPLVKFWIQIFHEICIFEWYVQQSPSNLYDLSYILVHTLYFPSKIKIPDPHWRVTQICVGTDFGKTVPAAESQWVQTFHIFTRFWKTDADKLYLRTNVGRRLRIPYGIQC